jgi:magnesium-transporting ATPase (P-type)
VYNSVFKMLKEFYYVSVEILYRVFQKSFTMVFQMLLFAECYKNAYTEKRKTTHEWWIVFPLLSVNFFVTLATQYRLEYSCKALFETPCIILNIEP